jgi:hypothetical protein
VAGFLDEVAAVRSAQQIAALLVREHALRPENAVNALEKSGQRLAPSRFVGVPGFLALEGEHASPEVLAPARRAHGRRSDEHKTHRRHRHHRQKPEQDLDE